MTEVVVAAAAAVQEVVIVVPGFRFVFGFQVPGVGRNGGYGRVGNGLALPAGMRYKYHIAVQPYDRSAASTITDNELKILTTHVSRKISQVGKYRPMRSHELKFANKKQRR